jgi:hypothetical protein
MQRRGDDDSIVGGILARVGTGLILATIIVIYRAATGSLPVTAGDELGIAAVEMLGNGCLWLAAACRRVCARAKAAEDASRADAEITKKLIISDH